MGQRKQETATLYQEKVLSVVNGKVLVIRVERFARKLRKVTKMKVLLSLSLLILYVTCKVKVIIDFGASSLVLLENKLYMKYFSKILLVEVEISF